MATEHYISTPELVRCGVRMHVTVDRRDTYQHIRLIHKHSSAQSVTGPRSVETWHRPSLFERLRRRALLRRAGVR